MTSPPPPMTIGEVAERWRVHERTVRRLIDEGKLECLQISPRRRLVPVAVVERYESERTGRRDLSRQEAQGTSDDSSTSSGATAADQSAVLRARQIRT